MRGGESANREVLEAEPVDRLRELGEALGPAVPRRILELYLGDSPSRMAALRRGLAAGDAGEIARAAHALRGSSANLGAGAFAELCHRLEKQSEDGLPAGTDQQLAALEVEYGHVERAIRELLSEFS